jgi:hypothetical protein
MSKINYLKNYTMKDDVTCDVYHLHVREYKLMNNVTADDVDNLHVKKITLLVSYSYIIIINMSCVSNYYNTSFIRFSLSHRLCVSCG